MDEVTQRMHRATAALEQAGIPYAVIGGNAVATWVGSVKKAAVRLTQDVDILIRRSDLEGAKTAMAAAGFIYRKAAGVTMFLDGPDATAHDAVHVVFAGEKVRASYVAPMPDVSESVQRESFRVLNLEALVRTKLTSFRRKDQIHILDLIGVGLVDAGWVSRFPAELGARLQELLDDPNEKDPDEDAE